MTVVPGVTQDPAFARSSLKTRIDRHGLHMFQRDTGANLLLDEIRAPVRRWAAGPRFVSIALTNACDLACSFCYAPKHRASLDANQVLSWLEELDEADTLGIGFGGGEPTVYPKLAWLCQQATARTGLAISFTTHAHRLTEELASKLRDNVHYIRVSMDGVGSTYEAIRGRSYPQLLTHLGTVRSIAQFGINTVVNRQTISMLDDVLDVAERSGASELLLLPERPTKVRRGIDQMTLAMLRKWLLEKATSVRLAVSESMTPHGIPLARPFEGETKLDDYAHIDASGVVRPSSFADPGVGVGDSVITALHRLEMTLREAQ